MKKIKLPPAKQIFLFFGVYFFVSGISFAVFSRISANNLNNFSESKNVAKPKAEAADFTGPKDQECPINGEMFSLGQKNAWEARRPLLVMIENHKDARPQSGLSRADVVYEAVAEGGITRFMGVFYCRAAEAAKNPYDLGPVRSARTYFLDWASEYSHHPLYNHVGGAGACSDETVSLKAKALCQIDRYGWKDSGSWNDMDQFSLPYSACRREPKRTGESKALEHTMFCNSNSLWKIAAKRGLAGWDKENFSPWQFKSDKKEKGQTDKISFYFWDGYKNYQVVWRYDLATNAYTRENGGLSHIDFLTKQPLRAKVVVVQFVKETGPIDSHQHMLYQTIGRGRSLIFQDGTVTKSTWKKAKRTARTYFYDLNGKEIEFNRGQIWIEALPRGNGVDYES